MLKSKFSDMANKIKKNMQPIHKEITTSRVQEERETYYVVYLVKLNENVYVDFYLYHDINKRFRTNVFIPENMNLSEEEKEQADQLYATFYNEVKKYMKKNTILRLKYIYDQIALFDDNEEKKVNI